MAAAMGCISPQMSSNLYLYRVSTVAIMYGLASDGDLTGYFHPAIPEYWTWGVSGVCEERRGLASRCFYNFPPTFSTEDLLRRSLDSVDNAVAEAIVENWQAAYERGASSAELADRRVTFVHLSRASAASLILSLLVGLANVSLVIANPFLEKRYKFRPWRRTCFSIAIADTFLMIAVFVMAILSMVFNEQYRRSVVSNSTGTEIGAGLKMLAFGLLLKFGSIPIVGLVIFLFIPILIALVVWGMLFKALQHYGGYRGRTGIFEMVVRHYRDSRRPAQRG